jgi:NAD(P)-dependent dehydrogenase (short-subunit alcohol dehydrogenase family)
MNTNFEGKVALVTGASSGIGRATAIAFGREGAKVVVAARRVREGEETAALIREAGGEAIFVKTDVSISTDVESLVQRTLEVYGRLDYAFNNAGISGPSLSLLADLTEQDWDSVIDANLKSIWLSMKYEIPTMLRQGTGSIINMSSILGVVGTSLGTSAYVASKHAIIGLTKAAALEYAKQGLRINAVCPGFIQTALIEVATNNPHISDAIVAAHPVGRIGKPEEVAEAVIWLCSDGASFITGQSLVIDGGYIAQ